MRISDWSSDVCSSDLPAEARPPYQGKVNVDPSKDAWRPVTSEAMRQATSKDAFLTKPRFSVSANVDFDGDGHIDTAQMVNNSRQGAVFVTFGGPNRRAPDRKSTRLNSSH